MAAPKLKPVEDTDEAPLYGDTPVFTYTPKDGGDPIVWPAGSTIMGEVDGKTFFEMLWEFDEDETGDMAQVLAFVKRSGATREMKRRFARLPVDERTLFLREWLASDGGVEAGGVPGES